MKQTAVEWLVEHDMKQTAVEWLVNQYIEKLTITPAMVEQAKAMEKEQIENVFDIVLKRANETKYKFYTTAEDNGFNYYNETFKSE